MLSILLKVFLLWLHDNNKIISEMKENPDMSKDYVNDPVMTAKLQKLIDIGIIRFDSRHGKVYPQHEVHDF